MGCCLFAALILLMPRLVLFLLWLLEPLYLRIAYGGNWVLPLLGFFLLPWTTLAYAYAVNARFWPTPEGWLIVIAGLVLDLISSGGFGRSYRRRYY